MRIVVGKDEIVTTITEALRLVTDDIREIYVKKGIYHEKIVIDKRVSIIGESKEDTVITFNDYALKLDEKGNRLETFRSYTVLVLADYVKIENITIKNEAGLGKHFGQAVNLFVNADWFYMKNCIISGHQDTLLTGPIPRDAKNQEYLAFKINHEADYHQLFDNCLIFGDIDFIFGSANAYFYKCRIFSYNLVDSPGYISAPSTEVSHIGHVFLECELLSDKKDKTVYLGRPWREYGYCAYINCFMDGHIHFSGFTKWNDTLRHLTASFYEYKCYGPGAIRNEESISKTISDAEVKKLYDNYFLYKQIMVK